jgi:hypothetical protein
LPLTTTSAKGAKKCSRKTGGRKKGTPNKPKLPVSNPVPNGSLVVSGPLKKYGGSNSDVWNNEIVIQAVNAVWLHPETSDKQRQAALAGLSGIGPRDKLEGMMAAQLVTAHNAAMECYRRAMIPEQNAEARRENLAHAGKLSRTFATLLEALNRQGKEARRRRLSTSSGGNRNAPARSSLMR